MTRNEEIKYLMYVNNISIEWLSEQLGMKTKTLAYFLAQPELVDDELYSKLKEIISTRQYEPEFFQNDHFEFYDLFDDVNLKIGVGDRIRIFAKRRYGSISKLARALEIKPQQLQQYISGKREPGAKTLIRFLKIGCDINWLLGGAEKLESYRIFKLENEVKKLRNIIFEIEKLIKNSK